MANLATFRHIVGAAALSLPVAAAIAQTVPATPASAPETSAPEKNYALPAAEIIGFDLLLSGFNRAFSGSSDYDVSIGSIRRNLHGPWVVDNDPFSVNQFAHPYQGSLYHGAARSAGLSYWEASAYTFAGSVWWEITGEQTPPSRNDQVASGIAGSFLGEPLYRMARLLLTHKSDMPYRWREWAAAAVSPSYGLNRLAFGERYEGAFDDHDPVYYSRLRVGANRATGPQAHDGTDIKHSEGEIDFAMDYGLPGQARYTYDRPFDYFSFRAAANTAHGVELLSSRGLLFGAPYSGGDSWRGIWGLYANYDYVAPQIFHVSTTGLSLGSTGQWFATRDLVVQGTAMAGVGYSAASTSRPNEEDRNYHYGMAPRAGLSMRVIAGTRASLDIDGQRYFIGRIANRSAGRDDITRVDTSVTWRISGRHAIGLKYAWSHRATGSPTLVNGTTQTLASVGIYYTLLGLDTFGTVDWRDAAQ